MILVTDLSNAFDIINHPILLQKMEHVGIRGEAYAMIESYLQDGMSYCEAQGFFGSNQKSRPFLVIQGGKLSGRLCGIFTIEMTKSNKS